MLSVSKAMSAGDASSYFSTEDYYLKGGEASQWLGSGAEALGLDGTVEKEAFLNVCEGYTPDGRERLVAPKITKDGKGNQVESHRAGNDLTFSAPKSVSIAYAAGVAGIKDAHDAAVKAMAVHIEKHYSQARTPDGIQNGTLVAAKFDHVTSRAIDPQLHSHLFVENMTQTPDGQYRANEPKNIFVDQKALGLLYRQELINVLEKSGLAVEFTDREQLLFEIKGVDPKLIEEFSSRREAIEAKVAEWRAAGEHKGVSEARLFEMAALDTRDRKIEISKEDVLKKWDQGFEAVGTSREQVRADLEAAREQVLENRQLQQPPEAGKDAGETTKEAARILTDKEAVMDRALLLKTAAQISGGQHTLKDLNTSIDGTGGIERLGQSATGRQAGKEFYTTTEIRELEARNIETLKSLGDFKSNTSRPEVEAYLAGLAGETPDRLTPERAQHVPAYRAGVASAERHTSENRDGRVTLSPGQREHVINELAGEKGFAVTQGDPGTGKTFASEIVERFNAEVLEPSGRGHYTLNAAYTGKAAMEMSAAAGKPSYTIDSFLNRYHRGQIQIDTSNQVREQNQDAMSRAASIAAEGERHAGKLEASSEKSFQVEGPAVRAEGSPDSRVILRNRDAGAAIVTKASVWGPLAKGTTTTVRPGGSVIETKWEGREEGERFGILKSAARESRDPEHAEKHLSGTAERTSLGVVLLAPDSGAQISRLEGERQDGKRGGRGAAETPRQPQAARPENGIAVPKGSQVVLKVDEASFVGARQAEHLLNVVKDLKAQDVEVKIIPLGDYKQLQGIQAGPFFSQASTLARQGYGDYAEMKEISRQRNPELLQVVETLNRDGDQKQLGANSVDALDMLQAQGRVTEIADRQELVQATVDRYLSEAAKPNHDPIKAAAGEKQSVLLVTALNADRHDLNREIREARITAGEIERGNTYEVLTPARQGVTAGSYEPGQVINFNGERGDDGHMRAIKGTRLNAEGEVQSIDPEKNTVTVRYQMQSRDKVTGEMTDKNVTVSLNATELANTTTLYNREESEFAQGEQIVFLKNDKSLGVENGNTGVIQSLDKDGNLTVLMEGNREVSFNFKDYANVDYGYAVTIHKSQGATIDSVMMFAYLKPSAENEKSALEAITGVKMTGEQFSQWNGSLSEFEKDFYSDVMVGGHAGSLEFVLLEDRREESAGVQKGIAIHFEDGKAMVEDEATRLEMRDAGMYWVPALMSWVTSATNDKAAELMDQHPLKDAEYLEHLQGVVSKGLNETADPDGKEIIGDDNGGKKAELDSSAELEKFGRASANALNVAVSRARDEAHVMTNTFDGLEKAAQAVDEKTTTVEKAGEFAGTEPGKQLAEKIEAFDKVVQGEEPAAPEVDELGKSIRELQDEVKNAKHDQITDSDHALKDDSDVEPPQILEDTLQNENGADQVADVELDF
jgi:conjugative relaxase-like TrwC/TraI family protein